MDKYLFSYAAASDPTSEARPDSARRARDRAAEAQAHVSSTISAFRAPTRASGRPRCARSRSTSATTQMRSPPSRGPGPVVFVANHPYGVLDGIVMSWLVSKVRSDFVVLTHVVLTACAGSGPVHPAGRFFRRRGGPSATISPRAPWPARISSGGGAVVVFPAGAISTAPDKLGRKPAVDVRWQPFVSQLIQRSKAAVVPIWFGGQNSRLFQIASHLSLTLRLSLIFHEVRTRIGACLPVVIGAPIPFGELAGLKDRQALARRIARPRLRARGAGRRRSKGRVAGPPGSLRAACGRRFELNGRRSRDRAASLRDGILLAHRRSERGPSR